MHAYSFSGSFGAVRERIIIFNHLVSLYNKKGKRDSEACQ